MDPLYSSSTAVISNAAAANNPSQTSKVTVEELKLRARGKRVNLLCTGSYFGHQACMNWNRSSPFFAVTDEYTELLVISEAIFRRVLSDVFKEELNTTAAFLARQHTYMMWQPLQLATLCLSLTKRRLAMGECIFRQGMEAEHIYFIRSGSVQILVDPSHPIPEAILTRLKPPRDFVIVMFEKQEQRENERSSPTNFKTHKSKTQQLPLEERPESGQVNSKQISANSPPPQWHRLHVPLRSLPLCTLLPGETLTGIEQLCGLKEHLFTAVCNSEVELFQMSLPQFDHIFPKHGASLAALEKLEFYIEQVSQWKELHPNIQLFNPLCRILEQQVTLSQKSASKRSKRGQMWKSPEDLAKYLVETIAKKETRKPSPTVLIE